MRAFDRLWFYSLLIAVFSITLVNLQSDASRASPDFGRKVVDNISAEELRLLFERFCAIDPIQNVEAEPEIIVEYRRKQSIVSTGQRKLYLRSARRTDEPVLVFTPQDIIAELDGSAMTARTQRTVPARADYASNESANTSESTLPNLEPPPTAVLRAGHRVALVALALGLLGYLGSSVLNVQSTAVKPAFVPIKNGPETEKLAKELAGVYMTGLQPGEHGLALTASGTITFFQVNALNAPNRILDTFVFGRVGEQLCLLSHQPGGIIRFEVPDSLVFCGETYRRLR